MHLPPDTNTQCGIYRIVNRRNGKFYVGSTKNAKVRCSTHFRLLRNGKHHCDDLQNEYTAEVDKSVFEFQMFIFCSKEARVDLEQNCLDFMTPDYNASKLARRIEHSAAVRAKMSAAKKGKPGNRRGTKASPETLQKMSEARRRIHLERPDIAARQSASLKKYYQENGCPDRTPSLETRKKISISVSNLWGDPDYRKRQSESQSVHSRGLWESEDYRNKQVSAAKNSWQKPERRAKQVLVSWMISNMLYQKYWGA